MQEDLGQHLLRDREVIARIVKAARLQPEDCVLDAGAGAGALTKPLAETASHVWAVDVDPLMLNQLTSLKLPNVTVENADVLHWPFPDTLTAVVANPPYKILAPLIERIANAGVRGVFVVPRELADRLSAKPGSEHYGKLTIRVQLHAWVEDLGFLPRRAFNPPPKVTSGIIRLRPRACEAYDKDMLSDVIESAWGAWDRKARHAFSALAPKYRADGAALAQLLVERDWRDKQTKELPPEAFAEVARHLSAGRRDQAVPEG